jgi:alkanesulfonate monooxygenase SsuD/methylene tetrahydromethanopterin reductase-like flavin-dependent oxidoreductase (luciferase family)
MLAYRAGFRPRRDPITGAPTAPRAMIALAAYCAETVEEAEDLARPALIAFVRLRTGRPMRPPTREQARAIRLTPMEQAVAEHVSATHIKGTPDTVAARIAAIAARTRADEVMIATHAEHAGRVRSFSLLAEAWHTR